MTWKKHLKNCGKWLVINLAILFFLLLAIEMVVRLSMPQITPFGLDAHLLQGNKFGNSYGLFPQAKGVFFGAEIITDEHGFRIDPSSKVPERKKSILVVGDSVSLGVGVAAVDAYPYILGSKLKEYRTINASAPGHTILDYYNVLNHLLPKMEFEGVILGICLNDFSAASQQAIKAHVEKREEKQQAPPSPTGFVQTLKQEEKRQDQRYPKGFVRFLRYLNDNYFNFNRYLCKYSRAYILTKTLATDVSKNWYVADTSVYHTEAISDSIGQQLEQLQELATRNKKWVLFCLFPYEYQLRVKNNELLKPQTLIHNVAKAKGLTLIDLYPYLQEHLQSYQQTSRSLYLFHDPMHFSPQGHKIVAEAICQELSKSKRVE